MMQSPTERYMEQLRTVLDRDIVQLEQNIARLNTLRSLLVKQDKDALQRLLETIRTESGAGRDNEKDRQRLREQLAGLFGCSPEDITLSYLQQRLGGAETGELAARKHRLQALATQLKTEYTATQMLLTDCARFNRQLLNSIFQNTQSGDVTYKPTGATDRQTETVLMNMEF